MNFFENYETNVLEELQINVSKNFFKEEEKIDGVMRVVVDYSAHYNEYRLILNSIWDNFDSIKDKYPQSEGITLGYIFYNELREELLRRKIEQVTKKMKISLKVITGDITTLYHTIYDMIGVESKIDHDTLLFTIKQSQYETLKSILDMYEMQGKKLLLLPE